MNQQSGHLSREEHIEQEYFFRVYRERLEENVPSQEILNTVHEEILSTTRLPMAIDFMRAEIHHNGRISDAMARLSHYFTPWQAFVIARAEEDVSRFDQTTALEILERQAGYFTRDPTPQGLFVFQFECLTRNRLGFREGLQAIAGDSFYDERWQNWIRSLNNRLGAAELSELVFRASDHFVRLRNSQAAGDNAQPELEKALFAEQDGRIAKANIGREPLYFFAALQRQLDYPEVPRALLEEDETLPRFLEDRLHKIEQRLKITEMELKGGIDLTRFYKNQEEKPQFGDDVRGSF